MTTRRNILKGGAGLAAILASGKAPAALVKAMLAARKSIGMKSGGAKLPYDAEVEWIATDGLSWIDTGIPMSSGMEVIAEHMFVVSSSKRQLMGSNVSRQYYGVNTSGYIEFGALDVNASAVLANANTIYTISYKAENGDNICSIYSGGSLLFHKSGAYYSFSGNFIIFNIGGNSQFQFISGNRIYSFKMLFGGILVRDMTPVRFTNELGQSEGAMYDRVSGRLFRNQGTGAFLYGNDK